MFPKLGTMDVRRPLFAEKHVFRNQSASLVLYKNVSGRDRPGGHRAFLVKRTSVHNQIWPTGGCKGYINNSSRANKLPLGKINSPWENGQYRAKEVALEGKLCGTMPFIREKLKCHGKVSR